MDKLTQSLKIDKSATCAFSDCISVKDFRRACDGCLIRPVANRLSEYEDTGLTPKEVEHICITLRNNGYKHINHMLMTVSKLLDERNKLREKLEAAIDDLNHITNVLNCDFTCANATEECKKHDKDKGCKGYVWRGMEVAK